MGGAERAERRRKRQVAQVAPQPGHAAGQAGQAAGQAERAKRAGRETPVRGLLGVFGVTMVLALVLGIAYWLQNYWDSGGLPPTIPVAESGPAYPVTVDGEAVVTGRDGAPVTIEVYEDFLCPGCGQLAERYGEELRSAAAAGQARVIYRPVAILDGHSDPPGYSTRAAGAVLCAAEAGIFPRFHASLFATQPRGGGPGWSNDQLVTLGRELGAGADFASCVHNGYEPRIAGATARAEWDLSFLLPDEPFGTPTVLVDGAVVDYSDPDWLDRALSSSG